MGIIRIARPEAKALLFFLASSGLTSAQAATLSFKEAEKTLFAQGSELIQKKQEVEIASANLRLGYAKMYPKASANWADQKRGARTWSQTYSLDVEASLFSGGAEYSAIAGLTARQDVAELALKDYEDLLRVQLARVMLDGSLATGKLEVLMRTKKAIDERVTEQRRRLRLGQVREPDLLQTEMESLRLDRSTISLEQDLRKSGATLRSMLALESEAPTSFPPLAELSAEIQGALRPRADFLLGTLRKDQEALKYDGRSTWRSHLPTLSAFASYGDTSTTSSSTGPEFGMGLRAQWVFFQGFTLPAEMRRADAQARVLDEKLKQAKLDRIIQLELKKAELKTYLDRLTSVKRAKDMARKAVSVQQVDSRRGIVTELEVLSSIQNYLELQTEELDLINQISLAHVSSLELGESL